MGSQALVPQSLLYNTSLRWVFYHRYFTVSKFREVPCPVLNDELYNRVDHQEFTHRPVSACVSALLYLAACLLPSPIKDLHAPQQQTQVHKQDLPGWPVEDSGESSAFCPVNLCLHICLSVRSCVDSELLGLINDDFTRLS